jgi:hypothetical protein
MLSLYRALTQLHRGEPALHAGDYGSIASGSDEIFAYVRTAPQADRFLIVLNFGSGAHTLDLSQVAPTAEIAVSTDMVQSGLVDLTKLAIEPNAGLVLRLK